jgi:hypothetical protein
MLSDMCKLMRFVAGKRAAASHGSFSFVLACRCGDKDCTYYGEAHVGHLYFEGFSWHIAQVAAGLAAIDVVVSLCYTRRTRFAGV